MGAAKMRVTNVGGNDDRVVVQLRTVPDPKDVDAPTGYATVVFKRDDDDLDEFAEGDVFEVSLSKVASAADDPGLAAIAAAKAIPNSTNTRDYKTPDAQKVVPPPVPDGVVTLPRPSVVLDEPPTVVPEVAVTKPAPVVATTPGATGSGAPNTPRR